jgi:hypothetical protein
MIFTAMPRVFPEMEVWGADSGIWTFIISRDGPDAPFIASAKLEGSKPFRGERHDLGEFASFVGAEAACEKFKKERAQ